MNLPEIEKIDNPGIQGTISGFTPDKGLGGPHDIVGEVNRYFGNRDNAPQLNPYLRRPMIDQTFGDQTGSEYVLDIGTDIRNVVNTESETPWFTIILPLIRTDKKIITGTIWKFNRSIPLKTAYHAPSAYVTEEVDRFQHTIQRFSQQIRMELDFYNTPKGKQNYYLKLRGISANVIDGLRYDVGRELIRAVSETKNYYSVHAMVGDVMRSVKTQVALFAGLNKSPERSNQLLLVSAKMERALKKMSGEEGPFELVVPPEWGIYLHRIGNKPGPIPYYFDTGNENGRLFIKNGPRPMGLVGDNRFWEYSDVFLETGGTPLRLLQRPVKISEWYDSIFINRGSDLYSLFTGLLQGEKRLQRMRNIYTYSLDADDYIEMTLEKMLVGSGIVPESTNPNDSRSRLYRSLVKKYAAMKSSAKQHFYPDDSSEFDKIGNCSAKRTAPTFFAWEPKGSSDGNWFIRVKYFGETDENVIAAKDHVNQAEIMCVQLTQHFGPSYISLYSNAMMIRRRLQNATDNKTYWERFIGANIVYSLTNITNENEFEYNGTFSGSKLSEALDYNEYSERWGRHVFDNIGELATQPDGTYIIPNKDEDLSSLDIPPGCDCYIGIKSIAKLQDDSGWDPNFIRAVREHEQVLLTMFDMAKTFPGSELVNPLNREPWVHNNSIGSASTAYANGVSQFRAPIFLKVPQKIETLNDFLQTDNNDEETKKKTISITDYDNTTLNAYESLKSSLVNTRTKSKKQQHKKRTANTDVLSLELFGDDDESFEDEISSDLDNKIIKIVEDMGKNGTTFAREYENTEGNKYGKMYAIDYTDDEIVRGVYISYALLNAKDDTIIETLENVVRQLLDPNFNTENQTTVVLLTNDEFKKYADAEPLIHFNLPTEFGESDNETMLYVSFDFENDDANIYPTDGINDDDIIDEFNVIVGQPFVIYNGPFGARGSTGMRTKGHSLPDDLTKYTFTISDEAGYLEFPVRCALVITPGMINTNIYNDTSSILFGSDEKHGYMLPLDKDEGSSRIRDVEEEISEISSQRIRYSEWDVGKPKTPEHFSFNQVHAKLVGMDENGIFPVSNRSSHSSYTNPRAQTSSEFGQTRHGGSQKRRRHNVRGRFTQQERFEDFTEEGEGFKHPEEFSFGIGARRKHSYFGTHGKKRGRFTRTPYAHDFSESSDILYSEDHGHILEDYILPNGSIRKGYKMIKRFNGSNFVKKMEEISDSPSSIFTFFTIAAMMSHCSKLKHWMKLVKNKMHVPMNFLLFRFISVYAESALLLKGGLGYTILNHSNIAGGVVVNTKTMHSNLTIHYGARVVNPQKAIMMEDLKLAGYIGGKGDGVIKSIDDLDFEIGTNIKRCPSFIVYAIPITEQRASLPSVLTISGRYSLDDSVSINTSREALFSGVDWHERRFMWDEIHNSDITKDKEFSSRGFILPRVSLHGWQASYDINEAKFKVSNRGEGHLSGGDYPGALDVVNGDAALFDYPGDPDLF